MKLRRGGLHFSYLWPFFILIYISYCNCVGENRHDYSFLFQIQLIFVQRSHRKCSHLGGNMVSSGRVKGKQSSYCRLWTRVWGSASSSPLGYCTTSSQFWGECWITSLPASPGRGSSSLSLAKSHSLCPQSPWALSCLSRPWPLLPCLFSAVLECCGSLELLLLSLWGFQIHLGWFCLYKPCVGVLMWKEIWTLWCCTERFVLPRTWWWHCCCRVLRRICETKIWPLREKGSSARPLSEFRPLNWCCCCHLPLHTGSDSWICSQHCPFSARPKCKHLESLTEPSLDFQVVPACVRSLVCPGECSVKC